MAMRRLQTAAAHHPGLLCGSGWRHMALASRGRDLPQTPARGQEKSVEVLWKEFFSDPSQWWDHRYEKVHARYPDFKHKITKEALWLNGKFNPSWVQAELAAMEPGAVQMNLFSWNARLVKHTKSGQPELTLKLFRQMEREGLVPDRFSFVPVLNACASLRAIGEGRRIHARVIRSHCESNLYVSNSLIDMYSKCGSIEDAWRVFKKMHSRDVVSWNSMIMGCVKNGQGGEALKLFAEMQEVDTEPDTLTFVALLNACAILRSLKEGRRFHEMVVARGLESNTYVGTSLVDMYVECGSMKDASCVFNEMPIRNAVSWNVIILGHVQRRDEEKALELFGQMQREAIEPDSVTFVGVLNACAGIRALDEGRSVHEMIIQSGLEADLYVASSLIDMYAKCGSIDDAWRVFNKMRAHDVVACNTMIFGHVKHGQAEKALELYKQLRLQGMMADAVTFVGALNACASLRTLEDGRRIHEDAIGSECESDIFVRSSLVDMYAKCGSIEDAWSVFKMIPERDVVTWNAMILGYVKCWQPQKALDLFRQMKQEGIRPVPVTFIGALNACGALGALEEGKLVHEEIRRSGCHSVSLSTSLVDMYANCGSIDDARRVFAKMSTRDVISWNSMIVGFVRCGRGSEALDLYRKMLKERVEPNSATFVGLINACANLGALNEGKAFHEQIIQMECETDIFVGSSLIDMYAKCDNIENARKVFNRISAPDVVCWSAMILGYVKCGRGQDALQLSRQLLRVGVEPDPVTFVSMLKACAATRALDDGRHIHDLIIQRGCEHDVLVRSNLIDMYAKCGSLEDSRRVFESMPSHDLIARNALVSGHEKCGEELKVWELYQQLVEEKVVPDPSVFVSVLNACASAAAVEDGRRVHRHIVLAGCDSDVSVCGALVEMYSACGSMDEAQGVLKTMSCRNVGIWNAMLRGYAIHGQAKETLEHFEWMCREGVHMNTATFDNLLSACSSAGLVDEGLHFLNSMSSVHGVSVTVDHCARILSLLVSNGRLREAEDLIQKMRCEPDVTLWMKLRDGCRVHGDHAMEQRVSNRILEVEHSNCL